MASSVSRKNNKKQERREEEVAAIYLQVARDDVAVSGIDCLRAASTGCRKGERRGMDYLRDFAADGIPLLSF